MRQRMGTGTSMRITTATGTDRGFKGTGNTSIGVDIVAAHHHVASGSTACHSSVKVNLGSIFHGTRRTGR